MIIDRDTVKGKGAVRKKRTPHDSAQKIVDKTRQSIIQVVVRTAQEARRKEVIAKGGER